jgi:regulator of nucleoside diphosphate kinase
MKGEFFMNKKTEARNIYITGFDMARLEELLDKAHDAGGRNNRHLDELEKELRNADVVDSKDIPPDVITMNSQVCLKDLDSSQELNYTLTFPLDADIDQNRISILAPIGTAMIGYRIGDTIEWQVPSGKRRLQVTGITYQPEAAGDFHL